MTCRPDRAWSGFTLACALFLAAAASGCADKADTPDPFVEARTALARGDGFAAEAILRKALENGATRESVAALMGEAELAQGNLAEARGWLGEGMFAEQSRAHGYHMLGRLEMLSGNLAAAGSALDRAYELGGESAALWIDVGRLRYRGGEQLAAIAAADKALELGASDLGALIFRGQLVRDAYGPAAALPWFEAALRIDPDNVDALAEYASTLGDLGRAAEMLAAVDRLSRAAPEDTRGHYLRAVLAARAGEPTLARALLERSGELQREVPAAMLLAGLIDLESGNYASAAQGLEKLTKRQPQNERARLLFARALLLGRGERELVARFGDAAKARSASPYLQTLVGRAYEALGDRTSAAWYLDRASQPRRVEVYPVEPGIDTLAPLETSEGGNGDHAARLRLLLARGEAPAAIQQAEALLDRFPGSADAASLAGDAQFAAGNPGKALEYYRRAGAVRLNWPLARREIMALLALGRELEAEAVARGFANGNPGNREAIALVAGNLAGRQDWNGAARLLDHAIMQGAKSDPLVLGMRAKVAAALGAEDGRRQYAETSARLQPLNPAGSYLMVALEREEGSDARAADLLLAKARALASNSRS